MATNLSVLSSLICQMGVIFFQLVIFLWNFIKFKLHQRTKRQIQMLTLEGEVFAQSLLSQSFGTQCELAWIKAEQGEWSRWRYTLLHIILKACEKALDEQVNERLGTTQALWPRGRRNCVWCLLCHCCATSSSQAHSHEAAARKTMGGKLALLTRLSLC